MGKQWKQCQTLFLGGSKITEDGDCSHEIKRRLLLGRKVMTNLLLLLLLSCFSHVRLCATPRWQPTRLPHPWDSPAKNTGLGCHFLLQCMKVKSESEVAQSCPTLSDPIDCSLPGYSVHGILQARTLEWVAISFSSAENEEELKKKKKNGRGEWKSWLKAQHSEN